MLSEEQIVRAYHLKEQGKTYRQIAGDIGLDPRTQHSQVVSALTYYITGYSSATRDKGGEGEDDFSIWLERVFFFFAGFLAGTVLLFILAMYYRQ